MIDYKKIDWSKAATDTLTDYEQAKAKSASSGQRKGVDLTKYFTTALQDGENQGEKSIRILPNQDDPTKWYKVGYFHNVKIGKRYTKLYDPAQDNEPSPLNDAYKYLMGTGDSDDRKTANTYRSRQYFIVRCIERGKEHEGVKFWRFPAVQDGSGVMDKIAPLVKKYGAFWNPFEGYDITISITRDKSRDKVGYSKVSSIIPDRESKLNDDENQAIQILEDPMVWTDVFRKKSNDYLLLVAEGSEPMWDAELKKFVGKVEDGITSYQTKETPVEKTTYDTPDQPTTASTPAQEVTTESATTNAEPVAASGDLKIDDLPF